MRSLLSKAALLATSLLVPALAHADQFTFTTVDSTVVFNIPDSPTLLSSTAGNFYIDNVVYTSTAFSGTSTARFYFNDLGQFAYFDGSLGVFPFGNSASGTLMYTGGTYTPTFIRGTYNLTYDLAFGTTAGTAATLEISPTPAPEPSSLLLMGTSLLGACFTGRRRFRS